MKTKLLLTMAFAAVAFHAGCSDDSSSSNAKNDDQPNSAITREDSSRVLVYRFDTGLSRGDVKIENADTTKISVDVSFAQKMDEQEIKPGNVIVVWEAVDIPPYYVRVVSNDKKEDDRLVLGVEPTDAFSALPKGEYSFSSEIFYDMSKHDENGDDEIEDAVFFNEKENSYHPIVIMTHKSEAAEESADDWVNLDTTASVLLKVQEKDEYMDIRELLKSNWTTKKDWTIFDEEVEYHPGILNIPFMGKMLGDYQGKWLDWLGGIEKLSAEADKANGLSNSGILGPARGFFRIDTVKYKSKMNFHAKLVTDWGSPEEFEIYFDGYDDLYISDIGFGLGAEYSGEKYLTHFYPETVVFCPLGIPIWIKIVPNFVFKYNASAYAAMDYRIQYKKHTPFKTGFNWKSGKGVNMITNSEKSTTEYNEAKDFEDFMEKAHFNMYGKGSVGVYLRVAVLFYSVAGPTVGIGARLDLKGMGNATNTDSLYFNLDLAAPVLELGGELSIMGKKLFSRAYDIDFFSFNLWNYANPKGFVPEFP